MKVTGSATFRASIEKALEAAYDETMKKGWNTVYVTETENFATFTTKKPAVDLVWTYEAADVPSEPTIVEDSAPAKTSKKYNLFLFK
ncbi:MAG: hypothetical protein LBB53_05965 [Prevotellaceae bacterium]|nr:hypothetical protein [Prevotellaceae bacterium]